jgi:hypothetical protein
MQLDKKQKTLIPLIAIVLGVLAWQLYGLMGTNSNSAASSGMTNTALPARPTVPVSSAPAAVQPTVASRNLSSANAVPTVSDQDKQRLRAISQNDTEYLRLIHEYQLLQVQRHIAEDTRAIAVAKLETAKALAETSRFGGAVNLGMNTLSPMGNMQGDDYKLVFTGQEAGQWTATLKINDQLMDVITGTTLPDGNTVIRVEGDSVILQKDDRQKLISFLGSSESRVPNANAVKQAKADAILQVIAPKIEVDSPKQAPTTATQVPTAKKPEPVAAKANPATTEVKPAEKKQLTEQDVDKSALTAAFLGAAPNASQPVKQQSAVKEQSVAKIEEPKATSKPLSTPAPMIPNEPVVAEKVATTPTVVTKPAHYTIQLMADRNEASVIAWIKQYGLEDKAHYARSLIKGQIWYVLTYGQYATKREAQQDLAKLPKAVRYWQPFIRSLARGHTSHKHAQSVQRQANFSAQTEAINMSVDATPSEITY